MEYNSHKKIGEQVERLFAEEEMPFGYGAFDSAFKLILGAGARHLVSRFLEIANRRESKDLKLARTALDFINKKLDTTYIDASSYNLPIDLAKLIESISRLGYSILEFGPAIQFNDAPKFYRYVADCDGAIGIGAGLDQSSATMSCIAEAVERRIFGMPKLQWLRFTSADALDGQIFVQELLNYFVVRSKPGVIIPGNGNLLSQVHTWTCGFDEIKRGPCWLPAQLVFYGAPCKDQILIAPRTSNGCAVGKTRSEAMLKAMLEIIERDAIMITWLKMIRPRRISINSIMESPHIDPNVKKLVLDAERYRLKLHLLKPLADFPVHIIWAVIQDDSGIGPAVATGASAKFDISSAIAKAVLESLTIYSGLRCAKIRGTLPDVDLTDSSQEIDSRLRPALWSKHEMLHQIEPFLDGEEIDIGEIASIQAADDDLEDNRPDARLDALIKIMKDKGFRIFSWSSPEKELHQCGFWPVRVIVPELMPLYLDEKDKPVHHSRLSSPAGDLNPTPHPLS